MLGVFRDARLQELVTGDHAQVPLISCFPVSIPPCLWHEVLPNARNGEAMGLCDTSKATSCNEDAASHRLSG